MWVAFLMFIGGIVLRTVQFFSVTKKKKRVYYTSNKKRQSAYSNSDYSPEEQKINMVLSLRNSLIGTHPVDAVSTSLFHILLFIIPLFLVAHNNLLYESWKIRLWTFSESTANKLTVIFLVLALFFFVRRVLVRKVRVITTTSDYLVFLITVAPFLTGFIAYHQWFDYNTILIIHIVAGELMLAAIAFTKLGHMVFFFFARFLIGGEYSLGPGTRIWWLKDKAKVGRPIAKAEARPVDTEKIRAMLDQKKEKMKLLLSLCAHCGLCAESCFLYMSHGRDPKYMPSFKVINSLGRLYKKKGKVDRVTLNEIKEIVWKHCVLCKRCYCPLGIDIPDMIAFARSICRSQGIYGVYPHSLGEPDDNKH